MAPPIPKRRANSGRVPGEEVLMGNTVAGEREQSTHQCERGDTARRELPELHPPADPSHESAY
jgi:hypothetical protein